MSSTHPSAHQHTVTDDGFRRALRDTDAPIAGGVAGGIAHHLGVAALWVRLGFVVAAFMGGLGILTYAVLWVFMPVDSAFVVDAPGLESASRSGKRPVRGARRLVDAGPAIALGALLLGLVLTVETTFGTSLLLWPIALGAVGIALLWRQADEAQRERWLDTTGRIDPFRAVFGSGGWAAYLRVGLGLLLVIASLGVFAFRTGQFQMAGDVVIAGLLGTLGLALVAVPWAMRLINDLAAERAERVRTQERADMASHLHDSVLQTLALIQKNSSDPTTVARLARSQERDLRSWLFEQDDRDSATVAGALREIGAEVELDFPVTVDVVSVGDCAVDSTLRPVVDASREAIVNAAKHSGVATVDVYAEVGPREVEVFVRDRGGGFDVDGVASDRHGVRGSIMDRMQRHGGGAKIRSTLGEGTEVRLSMPRNAEQQTEGSWERP